jgi:hypothetical protein
MDIDRAASGTRIASAGVLRGMVSILALRAGSGWCCEVSHRQHRSVPYVAAALKLVTLGY